jgi:predicted RNA-binding protein with PIN domain
MNHGQKLTGSHISYSLLADNDFLLRRMIFSEWNAMHIIVDGYNLIRQSDTFRQSERKSLEEGRNALIRSLAGYRKLRGHRITIVFDGWVGGSPLEERDRAGEVEIVYSRLGEKADEVIKRMLAKGDEEILVVTSDREIATFAVRRGKSAIASAAFDALLERNAAGFSPTGVPGAVGGDDDDDDDRPGMKRKGPSRRLSKQKRAALARIRKL